jgi:hypothetical protein
MVQLYAQYPQKNKTLLFFTFVVSIFLYLSYAIRQGYNWKIMPHILDYCLQASPISGLLVVCIHQSHRTLSIFSANSGKVHQSISIFRQSRIIQAGYTLQNRVCPKKHLNYPVEAPKSISNILKSPEKEEKAVSKHLTNLHFQAFSGLFALYSPLNPTSYDLP